MHSVAIERSLLLFLLLCGAQAEVLGAAPAPAAFKDEAALRSWFDELNSKGYWELTYSNLPQGKVFNGISKSAAPGVFPAFFCYAQQPTQEYSRLVDIQSAAQMLEKLNGPAEAREPLSTWLMNRRIPDAWEWAKQQVSAAKSWDSKERFAATIIPYQMGGEKDIPFCLELLQSPWARARAAALSALLQLPAQRELPLPDAALDRVAGLAGDKEARVRCAALNCLATASRKQDLTHFIQGLERGDEQTQQACLRALASLKATEALPALVALVAQGSETNRSLSFAQVSAAHIVCATGKLGLSFQDGLGCGNTPAEEKRKAREAADRHNQEERKKLLAWWAEKKPWR